MSTRRERAKAPIVQQNKQLQSSQEALMRAKRRMEAERILNEWKSLLLTDLAKLVFAGVILGGVFEKVESPILLYGTGFSVLTVFLYLGYMFLKRSISK